MGRLSKVLSRAVPIEAKIARRNRQQPRARRARIVRDSLKVRHDALAHELGPICGVTVVKDEVDILHETINNLFHQGVNSVLVADHGSTDGTTEVLEELSRSTKLVVFSYSGIGFYQAEILTSLAKTARRRGARWIIPFDADEFWFAHATTLADELAASATSVRTAQIFNVFPQQGQQQMQLERSRIDLHPHMMRKVAFRTSRFFHIADGNHSVDRRGTNSPSGGLFIAHFPWRSFEQFKRKARENSVALAATDHNLDTGYHWRYLSTLSDIQLGSAWDELISGKVDRPIEWAPSGPLVDVDFTKVRKWSDISSATSSGGAGQ